MNMMLTFLSPQFFKGTLGLQPGDSALFINGLHIDLETQDIFRYAQGRQKANLVYNNLALAHFFATTFFTSFGSLFLILQFPQGARRYLTKSDWFDGS